MRDVILGSRVMTAVGEQGITMIQKRTQAGRDASGAQFPMYSLAYARKRSKSGRQISSPDLTWTGSMLGNMATKFEGPGKAAIIFTKTKDAIKALGNIRKRNFFAITQRQEIEALSRELDRQITEEIRRLNLA